MLRAGIIGSLLSLGLSYGVMVHGQHLPNLYEPYSLYKDALELYQKEKYGAAQEKFIQFQQADARQPLLQEPYQQDAEYFSALCAYHLLRDNAAELLTEFTVKYPNHARAQTARFYLAKMLYLRRNYKQAAEYLAALNLYDTDEVTMQEAKFMLGYSYYSLGESDKTVQVLSELSEKLGPYHDQANYYRGVTEYNRANWGEALKAFKEIEASPDYRSKTPVYIANCLLYLKEYKALELFGEQIHNANYPIEQKTNIIRQIGCALYALEKYDKAMPYFEGYVEATPKAEPAIYYRMGYSCYKLKEFDPAIFYLKKVVEGNDTTAQVAAYYLAASYAALNKNEEARNGFKRAYALRLSPDISREALLQYAVLSFDTKYFEDALKSLKRFINDYPTDPNVGMAKGLVGEVLFYSNQFSEAIRYFEQTNLKDKRSQLAYQKSCYYYGVRLYEEGKKDSALTFLNKAAQSKVDNRIALEATFWSGEIAFNDKDYKKALNAYQQFIGGANANTNEYYPHALMGIAWCHFRQKNLTAAATKFKEVAAIPGLKDKNSDLFVEANLRGADCYFSLKEYAKAINQYQKVIEYGQMQTDYALYQNGLCHERLAKREDAIFLFKKLASNYRQSNFRDKALYELASMYLKWYSDYTKAAAYSKQLIDEHPNSSLLANAYNTVAISAMNADDKPTAVQNFKVVLFEHGANYEQAQIAMDEISELLPPTDFNEIFQQYKQKYPNTNIRLENLTFATGRDLYLMESKYPEAIQNLTQYLKDYPEGKYYHEAYLLRGECRMQLEQVAEGIKDFEKAATARNNSEVVIKALNNIAEHYAENKDFDEAIAVYKRAIPLSNDVEVIVPLQFGLGKAYMQQKQFAPAAQLYTTISKNINASHYSRTAANLQLGHALRAMEKNDSALIMFKAVASKNVDAPGAEAQYMVARVLFEQGQYEDSKAAVLTLKEKFSTFNFWKARGFIVMAENYAAQGERFQAMETLKSIIEKSKDKEIVKEAEKRLKEIEQLDAESDASPTAAKKIAANHTKDGDSFELAIEEAALPADEPKKAPTKPLATNDAPAAVKGNDKNTTPKPEPDTHRGLSKPSEYPPKPNADKKELGDKKTTPEKSTPPAEPKSTENPKPALTKPQVDATRGTSKPAELPAKTTPDKKEVGKPDPLAPKGTPATKGPKTPTATEKKIVAAAEVDKFTYHLIVEGVSSKSAAEKVRTGWTEKGFKVLLLEGKTNGSYRISIYQSKKQDDVQNKKSELMGLKVIPTGSWVFKEEK